MRSDKSYLARVQSMPRYYADGLYRELSEKNVFLFAQAIAFKVLVTVVPIVILLMGILGDILGQQEPFATVSRFVRGFLPPYESERLLDFLSAFQGSSGTFLSVGTVGLLITAMTLATTVRVAVASAFEQEWNENRSLFGGYAFDLRMVVQVGLLFVLTVGLSLLVQALNTEGLELMNRLGLDRWLRAGWRNAFDALSLMVPLLVSAAMFFQLFYFVPIPHPPKTSAAVGAFTTAILWEMAKYGFAFYATYVGTFDYQTGSDGVAALSSGFGLVIAFVLWVYYSGIVLMVGAVVASLHEQRRRIRLKDGTRGMASGSKLDAAVLQRVGEPADALPIVPTNVDADVDTGVDAESPSEAPATDFATPPVRPPKGAEEKAALLHSADSDTPAPPSADPSAPEKTSP